MYHWLDEPRYPHEGVTVPTLWMTIALSAIVHLVALFFWLPHSNLIAPWDEGKGTELAGDRLNVRLAAIEPPVPALPSVAPSRELVLPRPPAHRAAAAAAARSTTPPRPEIAAMPAQSNRPPSFPVPPPEPPTPPQAQKSVSSEGDLLAYVQARRRERGENDATPSPSNDKANLNAQLAANLPRPAGGVAAQDKRHGGGLFEIKRMAYDDAAYEFFGWNPDMERKTPQVIEVRKGNNSDMRIAVVRSMIAVIREHTKEDFIWRSVRHERDYTLSARPEDNAALEDFMMHEFFDDQRAQ
jgi:hypothetical protein